MATATSSADSVGIERNGSMDDELEPETPDNCTAAISAMTKKQIEMNELPTNGEESELDPLQSNMLKMDNDKDSARQNACLKMVDEDCWSKDFDRGRSQSPTAQKKGCYVRCSVLGFLVLLLIVGGASVVVLVHRFKGEIVYEFQFASYYGDHMVLQRTPHRAVIWGYGPIITDNTSVLLVLEGPDTKHEYRTVVRKTNVGFVWRVVIGPMSRPGPYIITASLEDVDGYKIVLQDVLFGDIWVCVEQNKIHLSVSKLMNGTEQSSESSQYLQDVRIFSLFPAKSDTLWNDLRGIQLPWTVPKSVMSEQISQSHAYLHFPGICWLYGKQLYELLQYPIGLVSVTYSNSIMEEWIPISVHDKCGILFTDSSSRIWNGMIHPMLDMQVFGLIWHQGDLDAHHALSNFDCALIEFIKLWRQEIFNRTGSASDLNLPVGIIQLPPKPVFGLSVPGYADIRWKQTAKYGFLPNDLMPSTFLAVTIDLPEINSNHISHKHDVVSRLVHGVMSVAYKRDRTHLEPFPKTYSARKGSVTLTFEPPTVRVRHRHGFEVCCSKNRTGESCPTNYKDIERRQVWLPALINDTKSLTSLTITSPSCKDHIIAVRYAWQEMPCSLKNCAIYSSDLKFPMSSFIYFNLTDDGTTQPFKSEQVDIQ